MTEVSIYNQADFPAVLKWQAIAFMKTDWSGIFAGNLKFLAEPYPPELRPVHFALHVDEALISYATVMRQKLTHAGEHFDVCCFGNMFTFPPYRHEGHGLRVLQAATRYIRQSDANVAGLFCDKKLLSFYAQCGWETMQSSTRIGTVHSYEVEPVPRMMLFLSPQGQSARHAFNAEPLYVEWPW